MSSWQIPDHYSSFYSTEQERLKSAAEQPTDTACVTETVTCTSDCSATDNAVPVEQTTGTSIQDHWWQTETTDTNIKPVGRVC